MSKKSETIELNDNEKALIENQRKQAELVEEFKAGYQKLVEKTGFAWAIDTTSPINNPQLGIAKVNQQEQK